MVRGRIGAGRYGAGSGGSPQQYRRRGAVQIVQKALVNLIINSTVGALHREQEPQTAQLGTLVHYLCLAHLRTRNQLVVGQPATAIRVGVGHVTLQ